MDILISYDNQTFPVSLTEGDSVAVYAVPTEYSDDGLYLAQWGTGELEPVPACAAPALLLRLRRPVRENGAGSLVEDFKSEGVSYAQN